MSHLAPSSDEFAAIERLLRLARNDTSQARCIADFLLAWWDPQRCGGFDFTTLWELDHQQVHDVLLVSAYLARARHGLQQLGFTTEMEAIQQFWR